MNRLSFSALVEFAKFLKLRDDTGGAIKVYDQDEYNPLRVSIDHWMTAEAVDEFNRITGRHRTKDKPTVPGWYWWWDGTGDVVVLRLVHLPADRQLPDGPANLWVANVWVDPATGEMALVPNYGEWQGPLEPQA